MDTNQIIKNNSQVLYSKIIVDHVTNSFINQYKDIILKNKFLMAFLSFKPPVFKNITKQNNEIIDNYNSTIRITKIQQEKYKMFGFSFLYEDPFENAICVKEIQKILEEINNNSQVCSIIFRLPVPDHIKPLLQLISPIKDNDALGNLSAFNWPAVSECVFRMMKPFLDNNPTILLIGGFGFVGAGVVKILDYYNIKYSILDKKQIDFNESKFEQIKDYNIIVSCVGSPYLLKQENFGKKTRIVIDTGYSIVDNKPRGDVDPNCLKLVQYMTPVPGGVGPLDMLILVERVIQTWINKEQQPWKLEDFYDVKYN